MKSGKDKGRHAQIKIGGILSASTKPIYIDNELGGYIATQYLLEQGHTQIACITGQLSKVDSRERLLGYRNALEEYGVAYDPNLVIEGRFDHQGNHEAATRLLDRAPHITAIFCQNDGIALAVYDIAYERGLKVGNDLSVVGFDNANYSQHLRPKLTTVHFPLTEMATEAANSVLAHIHDRKYVAQNKLMPTMLVRNSVRNLKEQIKA